MVVHRISLLFLTSRQIYNAILLVLRDISLTLAQIPVLPATLPAKHALKVLWQTIALLVTIITEYSMPQCQHVIVHQEPSVMELTYSVLLVMLLA